MMRSWENIQSRSTGRRRVLGAFALGTAVVAALAGCGDAAGSAHGGTKPTESVAASASAASSGGAAKPAGSPQTLSETGVELQVPADWSVHKETTGTASSAPPQSGFTTTPGGLAFGSEPDPLGTTDSAAKSALGGVGSGAKDAKRLPDLHVNGATLFHVQYEANKQWWDEYGTIVDGTSYSVSWQFFESQIKTRADADKLIQPVMATFKLTS